LAGKRGCTVRKTCRKRKTDVIIFTIQIYQFPGMVTLFCFRVKKNRIKQWRGFAAGLPSFLNSEMAGIGLLGRRFPAIPCLAWFPEWFSPIYHFPAWLCE
jgi:hypothetical protein